MTVLIPITVGIIFFLNSVVKVLGETVFQMNNYTLQRKVYHPDPSQSNNKHNNSSNWRPNLRLHFGLSLFHSPVEPQTRYFEPSIS